MTAINRCSLRSGTGSRPGRESARQPAILFTRYCLPAIVYPPLLLLSGLLTIKRPGFTVPLTVFPGKVEENDRGRVAHDARSPDVAKIRPFDA